MDIGYAEGARDVLSGTHQKGDFSFIDTPLSRVTDFLLKFYHSLLRL